MNKSMIAILLVAAIVSLVFSASAASAQTAQVRASVLKYEPYPAEPGSTFTVWLKFENIGNSDSSDVRIVIDPQYPFKLHPSEQAELSIGRLPSHVEYIKDIKMIVEQNAVEGDSTFNVKVSPDGGREWQEFEFTLRVQTQDATIGINSITTIPEKLVPGKEAIVNVKIKNMADSNLKDVSVKLDLYVEESATTATATDYPFAPLGSTGEKFIKFLASGESADFTFNLITLPNTESGVYKIPIIISYKDSLGSNYSQSDVTGFVVEGKPDLVIGVESSTVYSDSRVGKITLKFVNKGLGDIKFLDVKLGDSDDFDIISSSSEEYIGNLDSDDFDTVEFTISADKSGEIILPLAVEYKDSSNNDYSDEYSIPLNVITTGEAGIKQNSTGTIILIIILVIVVLFFVVRRIRKKRNSKNKK
ncbi:MAG: COG1361 S-layer family protein [Candidatus Woesearchaeota archaeon]